MRVLMKNWKLPGFVVLIMVVCMIVFVPVSADTLPETASDQTATGFPATVELSPPLFLTAGETGTEGGCSLAFNASQAGISSYVNVGHPIDLGKAVMAFDQIWEWDETHALGEVWIENKYATLKPLVYIDTSGTIVAYYPNKTVVSTLISWQGVNLASPTITDFTTNLAIQDVCNKTGISYSAIKNNIRYYHFGYPDADKILIFANGGAPYTSEVTHLFIPASYTQYEASASLVNGALSGSYFSKLYVDSTLLISTGLSVFDYGSGLKKGQPHTLTLSTSYYGGAVGNVILYSEG
jgi:hypothetical protein